MEWYEEEVKKLEERIKAGTNKKGVNLFYGSSSFRLWDSLEDDIQGYELVNNAFGGSTLEACCHFFDRLVVPMEPKSIIFYAGDNDLGDGKRSYEVKSYFDRFYYNLRHYFPNVPFTYLSIKPSPSRWELRGAIEEVNGYIKSQIEDKENCYFLDIYFDMLKDGKPNEEFFIEDKLHMSKKGYELWSKKVNTHGKGFFR